MFCTQCGSEIKDGFKFCPECGNAVTYNYRKYAPISTDIIANDVCGKFMIGEKPSNSQFAKAIKEYRARTGKGHFEAKEIIFKEKYGISCYDARKEKKEAIRNNEICPCCASQDIEEYEEPGITVTSKANVFGGMYISSSNPSTTWMRCKRCGNRWKPKKRR